MSGKSIVRCAKCGITSGEDSSLTFHRFPLPSKHGSLKARVWATYCFPDEDWSSDETLVKLNKGHKMLCSNHFDDTSYTSSDRKRLNKFAIPTEAKSILIQLRHEQNNPPSKSETIQGSPIQMEIDVRASTSHSEVQDVITETKKVSQQQKGILSDCDVKKVIVMSPRKQKLYKTCRKNLLEILRLRKKIQLVKKNKRDVLKSLSSCDSLTSLLEKNLSGSFYLLLQSQLKNVPRKLTGRRWSLEDKIIALSIYKKSNACYKLLRKLFCLPSISSLKDLLNKIPLVCGINKQIIQTLKETTLQRSLKENLCLLAFDEMSIRKNLTYNTKLDQIDGFQDHGNQGRTKAVASHALTFMAIGIYKKWKQPIAFYFSGASVTADRLSVLIKEVLSACFLSGLEVVGTVCDLDGVNISAINSLGSTRDQPLFNHEGHEIVTILDPPHLLKCFRNNFLKHDIKFTRDHSLHGTDTQAIARWKHIEDFYEKDKENSNFVFAPALTQHHLQPNGKQKMRVQLAAQVLSHSVAAGIYVKVAQNELTPDALPTAVIVSNIDKLFDCMNGDTSDIKRGKPYLTNMSLTSPHVQFFKKMKEFFTNMEFVGARSKPPSQEGWIRTMNAIEKLYNNFMRNFHISSIPVRRLNQYPLENCFRCIRSNCGCSENPTSVQFIAALKTSIVTKLTNSNKNGNCVDDDNVLLNDFKSFLSQELPDEASSTQPTIIDIREIDEMDMPLCSSEMQVCAYVCGFILKNINNGCGSCKSLLHADPNTEVHRLFTSFKEYCDSKQSLNYASKNMVQLVERAATVIHNFLKGSCEQKNIKLNIIKTCNQLNMDWLKGCPKHFDENSKKIIESTIAICLKRFCKVKNQEFIHEASKK